MIHTSAFPKGTKFILSKCFNLFFAGPSYGKDSGIVEEELKSNLSLTILAMFQSLSDLRVWNETWFRKNCTESGQREA